MVANPTLPRPKQESSNESFPDSLDVENRIEEFLSTVRNFKEDNDLLITGVPGSGRYRLINRATKDIKAKLIEVDCIKATSGIDLVNLLIRGIYKGFGKDYEDIITQKLHDLPVDSELFTPCSVGNISAIQLLPAIKDVEETLLWKIFDFVVQLPGLILENSDERVVVILKQISHIRSWDRGKNVKHKWERHLRDKLNQDPQVSYVILETIAELEEIELDDKDEDGKVFYKDKLFSNAPIKVIELKPISDNVLAYSIDKALDKNNLTLSKNALEKVLDSVQGHLGSAEALFKRLRLMYQPGTKINEYQVQDALNSVLKDLSTVFESLLLMLPASQLQLIECLAIEPTPKPHSKEYRDKYGLARGGTLQGAVKGLQQKGLIYDAEENFQLTLPFFATWIRNNLYEAC